MCVCVFFYASVLDEEHGVPPRREHINARHPVTGISAVRNFKNGQREDAGATSGRLDISYLTPRILLFLPETHPSANTRRRTPNSLYLGKASLMKKKKKKDMKEGLLNIRRTFFLFCLLIETGLSVRESLSSSPQNSGRAPLGEPGFDSPPFYSDREGNGWLGPASHPHSHPSELQSPWGWFSNLPGGGTVPT